MRVSHVVFRAEQQRVQSEALAKAFENLVSVPLTLQRVDVRLNAVEAQWQAFSSAHEAIKLALSRLGAGDQTTVLENPYFTENIFDATRECYLETVAHMTALSDDLRNDSVRSSPTRPISSQSSRDHSQAVVHIQTARLPRIDLPKFNGTIAEWLPFRNLFESLVSSNRNLSPVEKLQYLTTSVVGSAASHLRNTPLTAENFDRAWDALRAFYENDRILVNSSIQSLLSLKKMSKESASEMETLYTSVTQTIRTLETLRRPVQYWDDIVVALVTSRFDAESNKAWELHLGSSKQPPTWSQLRDFIMMRLFALRAYEKSTPTAPSASHSRAVRVHSTTADRSVNRSGCVLCHGSHYLARCPNFVGKTTKMRSDIVKSKKLCFNCLGNHLVANCPSSRRCLKCGKQHHTTLHRAKGEDEPSAAHGSSSQQRKTPADAESDPSVAPPATKTVCHAHRSFAEQSSVVLLATSQIRVFNINRDLVPARALLDPASEISLITERLASQLQLSRKRSGIHILGVGTTSTGRTRGATSIVCKPHFHSDAEISLTAHILPKLTTILPTATSGEPSWPHLSQLQLADPQFLQPGKVDIIIGADVYCHLLDGAIVKGPLDAPIAQSTKLGWIISGPTTCAPANKISKAYHCSIDSSLSELLERFWRLEEVHPKDSSSLSTIEQCCEEHFAQTHSRSPTGRYIVRLPFKGSRDQIGDSSLAAQRMLKHMERKFEQDPDFAAAYATFLREYEQLGHMKQVQPSERTPSTVFLLPHHGVIRSSSSTTKLRVVFNGSCSVRQGFPINELLHTGPKLQVDIIDVLLWFRRFPFVFSCDIEKMYRQIAVHSEDQPLQRILWQSEHGLLQYQLTTVTYGLACAPYLALKTIAQLVKDEGHRFPQAIEPLTKGRYVDDIFGGADTIETAQEQVRQVDGLCMAGGFPLRKWTSNQNEILENIPPLHRNSSLSVAIQDAAVHTLGMSWIPAADSLAFVTHDFTVNPVSKRTILSRIAQIFDPLGLLSPVTIIAKMFMQELWAIKISWDDSLSDTQLASWQQVITSLSDIPHIKIPRWLGIRSGQSSQIHGFCDASQLAMAAVVYLRTEQPGGQFTISLLCAKTKVAPLKRLTIPRLELSSAVMLTKLVSHVSKTLDLQASDCHMWTDSTVALTWIQNHPSRWKEFVHNRTCFIQETLPLANWHHISGTCNPADCASRGMSASSLRTHDLWWRGPEWLSQDSSMWPISCLTSPTPNSSLEERKSSQHRLVHVITQKPEWDLLNRFSSLTRLIRVTAWCKRALRRAKRLPRTSVHYALTPDELQEALVLVIKLTQDQHFSAEIRLLSAKREIPRSSQLTRLCPFLDSSGLLRVRGRLEHSALDSTAKHPYILPRKSSLSTLAIRDAHERTLHGSTQDTLSYLRSTYWIVGGRAPVRSLILKCVKCTRYRRSQAQQLIGQLPPSRVNPTRAFLNSGLDYAGPFNLKTWKGKSARAYKSWVALFICMATSAVHLELVTDYSSDAFLAAYRRFTARRGICATLLSDCGTTFKGADKQLRDLFSASSRNLRELATTIAQDGTKWSFNPPAAPHFGGKWEAGVKRVKYHLKRVSGDSLLTYEELTTLLTSIEAILNSRPLCPLSDDPEDLDVLTPGHFLIGQPLTLVPEPDVTSVPISKLQRWHRLTHMAQEFWKRWSREYLQRFHAISKWNRTTAPLKVGDLVFITDERYPPAKWPLGRIINVHPGADGLIRVVTLKTATSVFKRPIVKLCPLHTEDNL